MKLREFLSKTNEAGTQITSVSARISDESNDDTSGQWIKFKLTVNEPIGENSAVVLIKALEQARAEIDGLLKECRNSTDRMS
jgi:hypothetical protein